jgi:hypothetical protein
MRTLPVVTILIGVAGVCLYSHFSLVAVKENGFSGLIQIATTAGDPMVAARVYQALLDVHIPCTVEGSRVYAVSVPRAQANRAAEALHQDAQKHGYAIHVN